MTQKALSNALSSIAHQIGATTLAKDEETLHKKKRSIWSLEPIGYDYVARNYQTSIEIRANRARSVVKDLRQCANTLVNHTGAAENLCQTERAAAMTLDAALIAATELMELAGYAWALRGAAIEEIVETEKTL